MQKGFGVLFVLVPTLIVLLVVLGIVFVPNILNPVSTQPLKLPPLAESSPPVISATEPPNGETADEAKPLSSGNWKTYENKKYGYSLSLPVDWHDTSDLNNMSIVSDDNNGNIFLSGDEPCLHCGGVPRGILVTAQLTKMCQ